jgi:hypothetical protein
MILRRFFTLVALAVAVSLSFSSRAHASYDTSVSAVSAAAVGGALTTPLSATTTGPIVDGRLGTIAAPTGYETFVDQSGSTIYLVNQVLTGLSSASTVNEALYVSTASASDLSTWTVTLAISVTNPTLTPPAVFFGSGTPTSAGVETATYVMNITSGAGTVTPTPPVPTLTGSTTIIVGSNSFLLSSPSAAGQQANAVVNNGAVAANITPSAIPEPASVVLLGGGLAGVLVLSLRRRSKVA